MTSYGHPALVSMTNLVPSTLVSMNIGIWHENFEEKVLEIFILILILRWFYDINIEVSCNCRVLNPIKINCLIFQNICGWNWQKSDVKNASVIAEILLFLCVSCCCRSQKLTFKVWLKSGQEQLRYWWHWVWGGGGWWWSKVIFMSNRLLSWVVVEFWLWQYQRK